MFTGLIQRVGKVARVSRGCGLVLEFSFEPWPEPLVPGESVAVDGACLTVVQALPGRFTADVLAETEACSGLADLLPGAQVNLERAVKAGERLGGHIVQGHVDCRGKVLAVIPRGRDFALKIRTGRVVAAGTVLKGSLAVNGVSLTVSGLGDDWAQVEVIPSTAAHTNLAVLRVGDKVNLESDVLGKYAERRRGLEGENGPDEPRPLTLETLAENGFVR